MPGLDKTAKQKYGKQFDDVRRDLRHTDEPRVLNNNGEWAYSMFKFSELGPAIYREG